MADWSTLGDCESNIDITAQLSENCATMAMAAAMYRESERALP